MRIDLSCPVENQGVVVKTNSKTGEPYALFKLFNLSEQVVQAVAFMVQAYDTYGTKLGEIRVDLSDLDGQPKEFFGTAKAVSLAQFPEAKHITVEFLEVHFVEGDPYIKGDNFTEIKYAEPDYDEKMRLMTAAGEDAVCYAQDAGSYWLCVCGRPNQNEDEVCVRCGREKKEVMERYSSREALTQTISKIEEAQRLAEEQARQAEAEARLARSQKRKKIALLSVGGLIAVAVLWTILYFAYGGVMTLLGNSAAKKGDYLSAYARYVAAGNSSKVAEVSEEVRGNSNDNLSLSGFLTSDDENIYYLDAACGIHKQNKQTGETTTLNDATGLYLNVSDGWVYYLEATTGQSLCRVSTDGAVKEVIYETDDSYFGNLIVVGNELYFSLQEPREDLTPQMQVEMAQQGDGNIYQYRLYRMKIGDKKPKRVSDLEISQFIYYKDKIYFNDSVDGSLYCLGRNDNEATKLVSGPLYGFAAHNDFLYYLDGTVNDATGQPKLTMIRANLDGTYVEDVVSDAMVMGFCFDEEDLYYITYNEDGTMPLYKKTAEETTQLLLGCQLFNVKDGYMVYIDYANNFMKSTYDKTGFEKVELVLPPEVEATEEPATGETVAE